MKNLVYLTIILFCYNCSPRNENLQKVVSEIKINCFKAKDSTIFNPVMLKIELLNQQDSSFLKYYYCDTIGTPQPYIFTNKNMQFGVYLISASWNNFEDYKILKFTTGTHISIDLYLKE